jgi:hypothetical protein
MDRLLVDTPDTDEWWVKRLTDKLGKDLPRLYDLEDWMEGNPPLAIPDKTSSAGFERLQKIAKLNLAELIVNAPLYRMQPLTFRTASGGDDNGDEEANRIWKNNNMKVASSEILEWMLTFSRAYGIVGTRDTDDPKNRALLTAEHPTQVITEPDPDNPGYALAAIKIYRDDLTESDVIVLWRGNYMRVARRYHKNSALPLKKRHRKSAWRIQPEAWDWDTEYEDVLYTEEGHPVGDSHTKLPPVFEFRNRQGKGEFEKHLGTLNRINHTILQRMIIIAFQAFRQRGVKGVPNTDEDGKEIDYQDIFAADPGAVWILPEAADFWESGQADLTPVLTSVKDDIIHLAVSSGTPLFSVVPDAANGSAEGAALQREGLIFKTEASINLADGAFCRMMGAAFEILGDQVRQDVSAIEGIWASAKRSSLQERATAAVQAKVAGVPWRTNMKVFLELTPDQIKQAEQERLDDAFMQSMMGMDPAMSVPGITDPPRTTI